MVAKALKLRDRERVRLLSRLVSRLDGLDLRCEPIEERKAELTRLLLSCRTALVINRVFDAPGSDVFQHACKLGCEGIVSKRRRSRYVAGRTEYWLRVKNPTAPACGGRRKRIGDRDDEFEQCDAASLASCRCNKT